MIKKIENWNVKLDKLLWFECTHCYCICWNSSNAPYALPCKHISWKKFKPFYKISKFKFKKKVKYFMKWRKNLRNIYERKSLKGNTWVTLTWEFFFPLFFLPFPFLFFSFFLFFFSKIEFKIALSHNLYLFKIPKNLTKSS